MYDWEALWRDNQATITPLVPGRLPEALARARLIEDNRAPDGLTVYETEDMFLLIRQSRQPLLCVVDKRTLFDITLRLVDEEDDNDAPAVEWMVDNLATGESGSWQGPLSLDSNGDVRIAGRAPGRDPMPEMHFGPISFAQLPAFHSELSRLWQEDLVDLAPSLATELAGSTHRHETPGQGHDRLQVIAERYEMMVKHEQAVLGRRFSDTELRLLAGILRPITFETASSCRGLWLAVEAWLIDNDTRLPDGVDADLLLERLKALSYSQEVALIEALCPGN